MLRVLAKRHGALAQGGVADVGLGRVKPPSNAHFYDPADPALGFSDVSKRTFNGTPTTVVPYNI